MVRTQYSYLVELKPGGNTLFTQSPKEKFTFGGTFAFQILCEKPVLFVLESWTMFLAQTFYTLRTENKPCLPCFHSNLSSVIELVRRVLKMMLAAGSLNKALNSVPTFWIMDKEIRNPHTISLVHMEIGFWDNSIINNPFGIPNWNMLVHAITNKEFSSLNAPSDLFIVCF